MLDPNLPELKVLDYTMALQRTQSIEARGDLLNKGIYRLLITLYEWTEKFTVNKSLPRAEQLLKDIGIEADKLDFFLNEYGIKSKPPMIKKLNYLEYSPSDLGGESFEPESHLKHHTVFCRPTAADGTTSYRYATGLNDISIDNIKKWVKEKRESPSKAYLNDRIRSAVTENRLFDTYASTEIGNLFRCPFDKTKALKDTTILIHLKPILKKLVEDKVIFFIRNDKASKAGNKSVFYFFKKEEIFSRLEIYLDILKEVIIPDLIRIGVIEKPSEEDWEDPKEIATKVSTFLTDSYGDQKALVEEIILLSDYYNQEKEKEKKEEKKKTFDEIMTYIQSSGKIIDLNLLRIQGETLDEEMRTSIIKHSAIHYTEFADKKNYFEYILHKEGVKSAIDSAKRSFAATGNDTEITVLRMMDVISNLEDPDVIKSFEEAESSALFKHLPFLTWLWRMLMGNKKVHKFEATSIRNAVLKNVKQQVADQRSKHIAKRRTEIAEERIKKENEKLSKKTKDTDTANNKSSEDSIPSQGSSELEDDPATKEKLKSILSALDEAWDFGVYPDRTYVLDKVSSSMTEDDLIFFLKKKGGKDIYSYMVRNQPDKYIWPILITRNYLKKNGKKLLEKAEEVIQAQKTGAMREQMKYDLAVSLAEFLDRILPKIR
ncbi:MAG: hypothetical protein O9346_07490 [Leptospiraceae bacterium]|nr:hypothetical protein [Leptospiraceae bacterium]MCZ8346242.1 hypothetical protein [Leptospiraceae bacterium]